MPLEAFYAHVARCAPKSILALNGDLPDKDFFEHFSHLPILATDGAYTQLPFQPKAVIGDFDSIDPSCLPPEVEQVYCPDQNENDFSKAIAYAEEQSLLPALIVGMNGGHWDQVLANIAVWAKMCLHLEDPFSHSLVYAPPLVGFFWGMGHHTLQLPEDTKLSLFGFDAVVSTHGLRWELDNSQLHFPYATSSSNRTAFPEVTIEVKAGCVLGMVYLEPTTDAGSALS
jgi:thiamine pyrophosphokinase